MRYNMLDKKLDRHVRVDMDEVRSFGYWLRRRRKALDLTQEELARRVGCAVNTIGKIEGDARRPSRQMAARLAEVLALAPTERAGFLHAARRELGTDRLDLSPPPHPPHTVRGPTRPLPPTRVGWLLPQC